MELESYSQLYGIEPNGKEAVKNTLLVSNPLLDEVWFNRSVIYLTSDEKDENIMGFVQNKPLSFALNEVVDSFKKFPNIPVYCGGPVEIDRLFYIHTLGNIITDSEYIGNGLSIGGDIYSVLAYLSANNKVDGYIKFFLGYSGWSREQLKMEVETQTWGVASLVGDEIIYSNKTADMWQHYVKALGEGYSSWLRVPVSPMFN